MYEGADTLADVAPDPLRERRGQRLRSIALGGFAVFVLFGLAGLFGVRSSTSRVTSAEGLHLEVTHPHVARPGLAIALEIVVQHPDGFDGPITVTVPTGYLLMFDENGSEPEPDSSTVGAEVTSWTFEPPPGDTLTIWFDLRVEPGVQWGREATVTADADGDRVAVDIRTWIAP